LGAGSVEDVDDNAGDADTAGDGSACLEGRFVDCESDLDSEDCEGLAGAEATLKTTICQALEAPPVDQSSKVTVLGMPIDHLVCPSFVVCNNWDLIICRMECYGMPDM